MKKVSIITVNYKQRGVTAEFLKSVGLHTNTGEVEVVVVDNGCEEDSAHIYKAIYPEVIYIRSNENLGFSGGNNLGIEAATGKYLLFLNNDTEIVPDLINNLIAEFDANPEIGLLSPLILYYDQPETIQYAGFTNMNYLTGRNEGIGNMEKDVGQYNQDSRETGYVHGAAMMCIREDLQRIGPMPTEFFLYYEELDWCEKFRKGGKKIWFTGKTRVYHKESISVGKESPLKTYYMTRNRWLFIRRNAGFLTALTFSIYYLLLVSPKEIIRHSLNRRPDLAKAVLKGVIWNIKDVCS